MYTFAFAIKFSLISLCINFGSVSAIEPIITGVAVGTAVVLSAGLAGYNSIKCKVVECCDSNWIPQNVSGLARSLEERLHGQHLVSSVVIGSIKAHVRHRQPEKALVLSFHGWTGGGKTFVSRITAEHLYTEGMNSKFVHMFVATHHFPHAGLIETYKDQLRQWIKGNVSECGSSLFIFDETDKMPDGLLDTLKPYLDHYPEINGVDYRRSIFVFLSNAGGQRMSKHVLDHAMAGGRREDITLKEAEQILWRHSYNEKGGLRHSPIIQQNLITAYVPFLPMERKHVRLCVRDDLAKKQHRVTPEVVNAVLDELTYFPDDLKLYSVSGCKRVSEKVNLIVEELDFGDVFGSRKAEL